MKTVFVALLVLAVLDGVFAAKSAGCGKPKTLLNGTRYTVTIANKVRQFMMHIPASYDYNHAYREVFTLHCLNSNYMEVVTGSPTPPKGSWEYFGLKRLANDTAIFIAPDGLNQGWSNPNGNDIQFIQAIMKMVEADLCIETSLRFSTGWSFGGAMSYAIACALPTDFRAVAVLSGGMLSGCSGGTKPVAYLASHGVRDTVLNIAQGRQLRDTFVKNNGCTAMSPPEPARNSHTHIKTEYKGCSAGHPVTWIAFDEGHMPAPHDGGDGMDGLKSFVPPESWAFFTQFQAQ